jgi:pantoate kinase
MSGVEKVSSVFQALISFNFQVLTTLDKLTVLMDLSTGRCTDIEDEQLEEALNDPELQEMLAVSQHFIHVPN